MDIYLGYITLVGFNFAPVGWALCNGQLLSIADFTALFQLIGTTYGGDGVNTFAVPDLRGRAPIHAGRGQSSYTLGQQLGSETVGLTPGQNPSHSHNPLAGAAGTTTAPAGAIWANSSTGDGIYRDGTPAAAMAGQPFVGGGDGLPHENRQPLIALNYIIALEGLFPSQD